MSTNNVIIARRFRKVLLDALHAVGETEFYARDVKRSEYAAVRRNRTEQIVVVFTSDGIRAQRDRAAPPIDGGPCSSRKERAAWSAAKLGDSISDHRKLEYADPWQDQLVAIFREWEVNLPATWADPAPVVTTADDEDGGTAIADDGGRYLV